LTDLTERPCRAQMRRCSARVAFVENVAVGVLAGAVRNLEAENEAREGVDLAAVGVGVEGLDGDANEVHELLGDDEHA
jgi:hypothetical protein